MPPNPGLPPQFMEMFNACVASISAHDLDRAGALLKELLRITSARPPELALLQAHYRIATKEPKLALKALDEAAKKGMDEGSTSFYRAKAMLQMGREAEAERAFVRADKLGEKGVPSFRLTVAGELGGLYLRQRNIDKAHACFAAAIEHAKAVAAGLPPAPPIEAPRPQPSPLHPILYLPLEVKNREFDAKMLLALFAAVGGLDVVIGQKWLMQKALVRTEGVRCAPGLVMFKTMNGYDLTAVRLIRNAGHAAIGMDEEAFGRIWSRGNTFAFVHPDCVHHIDLVCAQNAQQVAVLGEAIGMRPEKAPVTGNPRADLYRREFAGLFQSARNDLRREHGERIILINGMSGNINSSARTFDLVLEDLRKIVAPAHRIGALDLQRKVVDFEAAVLKQYPAVIRAVAQAFPAHTVIFRPHPVEGLGYWTEALGTLPNLKIVSTGSIRAWLSAVDAMVFAAGCTTGLEAVMAGVPAVRFDPAGVDDLLEGAVSASLGVGASTPEGIVAAVQAAFGAGAPATAATDSRVTAMLGDWTGAYASEAIVKALAAFKLSPPPADMKAGTLAALAAEQSQEFTAKTYYGNKFPGIALEEVNAQLARLAEAVGISTAGLKVETANNSVFYIEGRR